MLKFILNGGPVMIPIVLLSVLAFAVIIDRIRAFKEAARGTDKLLLTIQTNLEDGNLDQAIFECESFKGPVAAVLIVGLIKFRKLIQCGKSMTEIESNVTKTMNDYAPHVVEILEKRLNLLTLVATVAPLLGMTGTVTGMINSFEKMAGSAALDATAVSGGISEALITTAAGLLVAIPAAVAYNIFSKKVDMSVLAIEESATKLIDHITLDLDYRDN